MKYLHIYVICPRLPNRDMIARVIRGNYNSAGTIYRTATINHVSKKQESRAEELGHSCQHPDVRQRK